MPRLRLFGTLLLASALHFSLFAPAQDFTPQRTIAVGHTPQSAAITRDGARLFVANFGADTLSVIDTASSSVQPLPVGHAPHGLLISHDGRRLYAIVDADNNSAACFVQNEITENIVVIDTATLAILRRIPVIGRTDALALTPDDRHLYLTRVCHEIDTVDLPDGDPQPSRVSLDNPGGLPVGIQISPNGQHMFVNYQGGGPQVEGASGYQFAHDALVEFDLPGARAIQLQASVPNVGDQVALSPDGAQVWTNGADTCSRPDYPHDGCPFVPSMVINALRVSDDPRLTLQPLKTFGFSLVEFNGRISISPQGEVFIGGGIEIKRIDPQTLQVVQRIPLPAAGDIAFSPDGNTAYVTVGEKDEVVVIERNRPTNAAVQSDVAAVPLPTFQSVVLQQNTCPAGRCQCQPGDQKCVQERTPTELQARVITGVLVSQGLVQPGMPVRKLLSGDEDWPCVLSFPDGTLSDEQSQALRALMNFTDHQNVTAFEGKQSAAPDGVQPINAPILTLDGFAAFQKTLGEHAVYLTVLVCDDRVQTAIFQNSQPTILDTARHPDGTFYTRTELRPLINGFRSAIRNRNISLEEIQRKGLVLYNTLLPPRILAALSAASSRLTLLWSLRDQLRYIPMGALWDGHEFLIQKYGQALETPSSGWSKEENDDFLALAAGDTNRQRADKLSQLDNVSVEIFNSFATGPIGAAGSIPATILLDDGAHPGTAVFSPQNFQSQLHALEQTHDRRRIVHIASHFVLNDMASNTYLLTQTGRLDYGKLSDKSLYPLKGVWLATFSACDTGLGPVRNGSEVESLAYIADDNGARSTVATLWGIADQSTSQLMADFYSYLSAGAPKGEALRHAQLDLLQGKVTSTSPGMARGPIVEDQPGHTSPTQPDYTLPYYWAPFVLIGEW